MSDLIDREWLLHATSILDLLSVGWQPGRAELGTARQVNNWAVTAASAGRPYQLAGTIHAPVPVVLTASLLAIDPQAGWARSWDEWIVLDGHDAGAPTFDPADVQRRRGLADQTAHRSGGALSDQSSSRRRIFAARCMKARTPAPCERVSLTG